MSFLHSKRFAATAEQLHQLRQMLERYIAAHWRTAHAADINKRQQAGEALVRTMGPEVRLDSLMAGFELIVDRVFREHYGPALPDALTRLL